MEAAPYDNKRNNASPVPITVKLAVIVDRLLASTRELHSFALSQMNRYKPVGILESTLFPELKQNSEYKADSFKDKEIKKFIEPILTYLEKNREALYRRFNMPINNWYQTRVSISVMRSGYSIAPHSDFNKIAGPNLQFIFLFYFHSLPKQFYGGDVVLHDGNNTEAIEPIDNRLVIFPGTTVHSVNEIFMNEDRFEDARFAVVGRIIAPPTFKMQCSRILFKLYRLIVAPLRRL